MEVLDCILELDRLRLAFVYSLKEQFHHEVWLVASASAIKRIFLLIINDLQYA